MYMKKLKVRVGRYIVNDYLNNSAKSWTIGNSYPGYDNVIYFHSHIPFKSHIELNRCKLGDTDPIRFRMGNEIGSIYAMLNNCGQSDIILFAMENNIISEEEEA